MYLPVKKKVLISLTDGTTVVGTVKFSLGWWRVRLAGVTFLSGRGEPSEPAAGTVVLIPSRSILVVQVPPGS